VLSAFRQDAATYSAPFEYPPNPDDVPDGFGIVQLLANAALRAHQRCDSIYTGNSLLADHGWSLMCDHEQGAYVIKLIGNDWKLLVQWTNVQVPLQFLQQAADAH